MKAKLIKKEYGYVLGVEDKLGTRLIAVSSQKQQEILDKLDVVCEYKLSLKNCQAIERGYDLDELAIKYASEYLNRPVKLYSPLEANSSEVIAFQKGFQKALELMGDKKFSEEDVRKAIEFGMKSYHSWYDRNEDEFIQSLQQTEWDVEVEMVKEEYIWSPPGEGFEDQTYRDWREVPKLGVDGCLILKRI